MTIYVNFDLDPSIWSSWWSIKYMTIYVNIDLDPSNWYESKAVYGRIYCYVNVDLDPGN